MQFVADQSKVVLSNLLHCKAVQYNPERCIAFRSGEVKYGLALSIMRSAAKSILTHFSKVQLFRTAQSCQVRCNAVKCSAVQCSAVHNSPAKSNQFQSCAGHSRPDQSSPPYYAPVVQNSSLQSSLLQCSPAWSSEVQPSTLQSSQVFVPSAVKCNLVKYSPEQPSAVK